MTETDSPSQGVTFWPVGKGDSATIVIDEERVMQVDLCDTATAEDDDASIISVIDRLAESLPQRDGLPYLAAFALTHADLDHCKGFGRLLDSDILVGEIWATPRLWREYAEDEDAKLCEDACLFHEEAERRVQASLDHIAAGEEIHSGDRVRVIGYDTDLEDDNHRYRELPDEQKSFPGHTVTMVDGIDVGEVFEAFIHAPFKDDCAAARNDTSLAMQVTLKNAETLGHVLLLGDLAYATVCRIFGLSTPERLAWDVLLAPHHCSRRVMYAPGDDGEEELKQDILDSLDNNAGHHAYVVASAGRVPAKDEPGANPPHAAAKARYEELGIEAFLCTGEYGDVETPEPVVFALTPDVGLELQTPTMVKEGAIGKTLKAVALAAAGAGTLAAVREAIRRARGAEAAPVKPVGFGRR